MPRYRMCYIFKLSTCIKRPFILGTFTNSCIMLDNHIDIVSRLASIVYTQAKVAIAVG